MNHSWRRSFPSAPPPNGTAASVDAEFKSVGVVTRLAVVGDVHDRVADQWNGRDALALRALKPDMTLFVGDIGNENVDAVKRIAGLELPKTVILGNHDAFYTVEPAIRATLDRSQGLDKVNAQLDALGDDHVGFGWRSVPNKAVSIVGARPFSGGGRLRNSRVIRNLYGYEDKAEYGDVIVDNALEAPADHALVIVGHNGPTGLGRDLAEYGTLVEMACTGWRRHEICGVDFRSREGDHGDEDLRLALDRLTELNRPPALVTFGHMHHRLKPQNGAALPLVACLKDLCAGRVDFRRRLVYDEENGTLFLNVAVVPRVVLLESENGGMRLSQHHFCLVELDEAGCVSKADDVYVTVDDDAVHGDLIGLTLFERNERNGRQCVRLWNTHLSNWEEHDGKRDTVMIT